MPPRAEHAQSAKSVLLALDADEQQGLSSKQASQLRERYGWNELASSPPEPLWRKFFSQFNEVVVWMLIVAAIVSGALGEWTDATAIIAIVLLNAILGFVQEEKAERALASLQELAAPLARVLRDGKLQPLPSRELVPGDIIDLDAGDNVPADARLLEAFSLRVQEAALTGESLPSDKDANCVLAEEVSLGDRRNMVYLGTVVAGGKARAVVAATGMQTELGQIAGMLQAYEAEPTPLQRKLARLGKVLAVICLVLVGIVFALKLWHGDALIDAFLLSVSLAVAAVPEGLPAVVTVSLALGLQRMVRRNALIRKLPSVETLGSVTVICSDKTGTLTRNEMTVRELVAGGEPYRITGSGYAPHGEFRRTADGQETAVRAQDDGELMLLLEIGSRCNHAQVFPTGDGEGAWQVVGDPTEGALIVAAMKAGLEGPDHGRRVIYEMPFDSDRKAMSVVLPQDDGVVMFVKGAPEAILAKCTAERRGGCVTMLTEERRQDIIRDNARMADDALRVLAFAYRDYCDESDAFNEEELVFVGLAGMIDPPREEVKQAVATCRAAGIRPIMITGDHPATAAAIARELGMATQADRVVTGRELDALSDEELSEQVEQISVYARVTAEHKLRVVRAWKGRGEVVAMTGDGVNDAPAVKAADIGIAMGITGTDVTRETSAMILMDDNFASIVSAVEEGRAIYDNIQKFLTYLLSCNIGEMLLMLVASLLGWPAPLMPVQLLWINLVTDGLPALALGLEPPEPGVMSRKPRPPQESMLSLGLGAIVIFQGILLAIVGLAAFAIVHAAHPGDESRARTMTFCVVVFGELFRALAARSRTWTFIQLGPFTNPFVFGAVAISGLLQVSIVLLPFTRPVFEIVAYPFEEWLMLLLLSLAPVTVIELTKLVRQWLSKRTSNAAKPS
ncbi:MAG TPA: cation-translocating P-type ATPase [Pirellulales bacterium]|nr:cation-translocating P-type ATPase [Pirellulales bacterium]